MHLSPNCTGRYDPADVRLIVWNVDWATVSIHSRETRL